MKTKLIDITYITTDDECKLGVKATYSDGRVETIGTVFYFYIKHLKQHGWEATTMEGKHYGVHQHRWQAALALTWNGKGYSPFPILRRNPHIGGEI